MRLRVLSFALVCLLLILAGCTDTTTPTSVVPGIAVSFPSATAEATTPRPIVVATTRLAVSPNPSGALGNATPWWSSATPPPPTRIVTPKPSCEFTQPDSGFLVISTREEGLQIELVGARGTFTEKVPTGGDFCYEFPAGTYALRAWTNLGQLKINVTIVKGERLKPVTICKNPCQKGPDASDDLMTECVCQGTIGTGGTDPGPKDPPPPPPPPQSTAKP